MKNSQKRIKQNVIVKNTFNLNYFKLKVSNNCFNLDKLNFKPAIFLK